MFLNIILTILVLVLIGITTLGVLWWKKYGKSLFNIISLIKNTTSKNNSEPQTKQNIGNINNAFGELNKAMEMLKNFQNGANKNGK
jgi:uncharacterized membrane protein (Fun14 family)